MVTGTSLIMDVWNQSYKALNTYPYMRDDFLSMTILMPLSKTKFHGLLLILFKLRFYGLVNTQGYVEASVYLTTLFLSRLSPSKRLNSTCAHSFARN